MADQLDVAALEMADEKKVVDTKIDYREVTPAAAKSRSWFSWLLPSHRDSAWAKFLRFFTFLGPGAIISVAYIDPDNYQAAITAGGSFQYKLLFMVLVSNIVAIYLQVCPFLLHAFSWGKQNTDTDIPVIVSQVGHRYRHGSSPGQPSVPAKVA